MSHIVTATRVAQFQKFREGKDLSEAQAKLKDAANLLGGYDGIPAQPCAKATAGLLFVELIAEKKAELKRQAGSFVKNRTYRIEPELAKARAKNVSNITERSGPGLCSA